tara:strand:- start:2363 stop:2887 length:525 start_codon:yes stop_codon:yes gene_type:complete
MDDKLIVKNTNRSGFTLVEVLVAILLTGLAFMLFLQALNTGKSVRVKSELRTRQSLLLNSMQNQIRARRFDENLTAPWTDSNSLGIEDNEMLINQFDDIDDFNNYNENSIVGYQGFGYEIAVFYTEPALVSDLSSETYSFTYSNVTTNYKGVAISVKHLTLPDLKDTLIITPKI